ncbi:HAD family hydrolase [Bacteroides gallinaceum]|uniref:HAD family hydrolase n=1 Tax=Bacteroides TaxID=816 RepID=UPI00033E9A1C|nr:MULTISPECIES: HAD family hydrolase [Bacteroides]CCZ71469.1 hAD-superfamily hydrolase subfamily IA variant 1 [Bacteroides sp. CAG:702]MBM6944328.1 HAD family hydrolase [Bacteroides gallinaceum]MDN0079120.1 HAD family hydrolase [Bacteroides gallinaceum]OUN78229.1 haloacid dehalogenase [Bacteroides sp. An51A]OUO63118.1 haloacid dehalogenase [Bacteroides sp. An279]
MSEKLIDIQGIIFDYGGTIDTNGRHWAEVLWEKYKTFDVPVSKPEFREAYVYGERTLAHKQLIKPEYGFHEVLSVKTRIQVDYLIDKGVLSRTKADKYDYATCIADSCYRYVWDVLQRTRPVLQTLSKRYKLVLVSNFYGNIQAVLKDFGLSESFSAIIESSVVGVRKPDPAIYQLGIDAMGFPADKVLAVGDSYPKDVVPAKHIGCRVAWLKGESWDEDANESLPDLIITDLPELLTYLL